MMISTTEYMAKDMNDKYFLPPWNEQLDYPYHVGETTSNVFVRASVPNGFAHAIKWMQVKCFSVVYILRIYRHSYI